ncbi:hypothetical protein KFL_002430050 [Klebsormidium nitens]|uniref:Plus3 domain-containing protein n=1 Tax=Klebsormidium nitens TaxID=105231 RepID=A0A1Y1I831_KLENI|nr:hypothetical protein KFL_002430050 [Klebsormidium nitens]|eukprot:GAQ85589.1 hypothetical protein KFL_002430050 [Klebsormidium nitens]
MAPFSNSLALQGNRPPLIAGGSIPRVQSGSAIPMRGGVWDMPTFPGDNRVFSNPNPGQLPRSSDNQGGSQERSGEINQTMRTSQDFSGSLDARKGSMSDSPTPEVQASGSVPRSTGGQSMMNTGSQQSDRFRALSGGPQQATSSEQQGSAQRYNAGQSANWTPVSGAPAVSSDMHAPKEPVRGKRTRSVEEFAGEPAVKRGRSEEQGSQEISPRGRSGQEGDPPPAAALDGRTDFHIINSRTEAPLHTKVPLDVLGHVAVGVKPPQETRTGSSGLGTEGIHSGEENRVSAIMAELGNMSKDYVSALASSGLSEIGPSSAQLPVSSVPPSAGPVTSAVGPADVKPAQPSTVLRPPQSYLPPSAWVRRLQPTSAPSGSRPPVPSDPAPTFRPQAPAVRPQAPAGMPAVRGGAQPARTGGPEAAAERGVRPRQQAPDRHAEVPSMSVSGMSGWERGQAFGRHFGPEPSFGGQTMRYLSGREPSAGTSFASFAVPVYRGSDAGASLNNFEHPTGLPFNPFQRPGPRPFQSPPSHPQRTSPTRASDALTSPAGPADFSHRARGMHPLHNWRSIPEYEQLNAGQGGWGNSVNFGAFERQGGPDPEVANFHFGGYAAYPEGDHNRLAAAIRDATARRDGLRAAPGGDPPIKHGRSLKIEDDSKAGPDTSLLPETPTGEDVEPKPALESSGEGVPEPVRSPEPVTLPGGPPAQPDPLPLETLPGAVTPPGARPDLVPNRPQDSPPEALNNEDSFGTKSGSPSAGVVPNFGGLAQGLEEGLAADQAPGRIVGEGTELQQALADEANGLSAHLTAKPSKPHIQSMPLIDLPEGGKPAPETAPLPFRPFVSKLIEGSRGGPFAVAAKGVSGTREGLAGNREAALEQATKADEGVGVKGMGKRVASKGAWMDRLFQQATGTAVRKKDGVEENKGEDGKEAGMRRESSLKNLADMEVDRAPVLTPTDTPQVSGGLSNMCRSPSNPNIQHFPRKEPISRPGGKTAFIASTLQAPWSNLDLAQALGVTGGVELARGMTPLAGLKGPSGMKVTGGGKDGSGNRRGSQSSADFAAAMAAVREWRKESARYRAGLIAESPILREAMALGEMRRLTCLFCGLRGHTVSECSETPRNELAQLEARAVSWGGGDVESDRRRGAGAQSPKVEVRCLLCQRKGHWGVDCPLSLREAHVVATDDGGGNAGVRSGAGVTPAGKKRTREGGLAESLSPEKKESPDKGKRMGSVQRRDGERGADLRDEEGEGRCYGGASGGGYEGSKERSKRSSHSAYKTSSGAKDRDGGLGKGKHDPRGSPLEEQLERVHMGGLAGHGDGVKRQPDVGYGKNVQGKRTGGSPLGEEKAVRQRGGFNDPRLGGRGELANVPPTELLDALEGARLPRRDLVRWAEQEGFEKRVEGFFLRVRFGRRAQEQNGSGYRIARIVNAVAKSDQGHLILTLTVDLGDGECIIDGQYVSNKAFTKEELDHWCQVSRDGSSMAVTLPLLRQKAAEKATWPDV